MDTLSVNSAPVVSSSPEMALKHWRDRAITAEGYAQKLEQTARDTITEIDLARRNLADLQTDVQQLEAYCSDQADEIAELLTKRRAGLFLLTIGLLLIGYLAGVLTR